MEWTPHRDARLKSLRERGLKNDEIADAMGLSANAVSRRLSKLGLTAPRRAPLPRLSAPRAGKVTLPPLGSE